MNAYVSTSHTSTDAQINPQFLDLNFQFSRAIFPPYVKTEKFKSINFIPNNKQIKKKKEKRKDIE